VLVLHAIWESDTGGRLHLWAESSRRLAAAPKRQGHYPPQSRQHPFALAPSELKEAITSLGGSLSGESLASQQVTILLPATQKRPLPSPWLIPQDEPSDGKAIRLTPWDVDTLALDPAVALDFLLSLPHQPPQGVAFSSSLGFWTEVAKFSLELIARQCFVPTLKEDKQNGTTLFRAAWEVALGEQDTQRMRWLSKAMPPCCRAHILPQGEQRTRPSEVILSFVNRSADAFIRTNLASIALSPRGRPKDVPLAEQWLRALSSADPRLKAQGEGLVAFANHIRCWLDRIKPSEAPFRTCFRLESPDKDQEWRVSFHLQANDDRSLVVPAEEVWKARKGMLTFLQRNFENPQERLLADLGKASRLFPVIDQSLEAAHPVGVKLDTNQAYTFLRQYASLLEQSGFGILVPPWWQKPPGRISVKLKVRPKAEAKVAGSGLLGVDSILNYNWEIAIGEETLSVEEFDRLASLKVPLVQIRGQWVELIPGEIEKAIAFFQKKQGDGEMRLAEALRLGLGQEYSEVGLPVVGIDGEGWVGDILNELGGGIKLAQVKPPQTFNGKLRPYQVNGLSWLSFLKRFGLGACLADDMGLGKCLSPDTLIVANGMLHKAEDIWSCYAGEAAFDGDGFWAAPAEPLYTNSINPETGKIVPTSINRLYRQRVCEPLRKVCLEDGSSVTITYRHQLLTNKGWTNHLHRGDYVCVPAKIVWEGQPEDPDLVKFIAWQIADGYEPPGQTTLTITQRDTERLEDLRQIILRISQKYEIKINCPAIRTFASRTPALVINSRGYERFLAEKGYSWGQQSGGKSIPPFIMQADLDSVRLFLRNYFDAEGSAVRSMRTVEISTASEQLIQQLSYLLRRFGIWMRISTKKKRATNGTGTYRPYYIGTIDGNGARIFQQEIGFSNSDKRQRLRQICDFVANTNIEGITASQIVAQAVAATRLPIRHFGMYNTVYVNGSQQFSRHRLEHVLCAFDNALSGEAEQKYQNQKGSKWATQTLDAYSRLDEQLLSTAKVCLLHLLDQEVYYCKIREIEEIEHNGWVYDFAVEKHHNFVANNILCHNTIEFIAFMLHERVGRGKKSPPGPTLLICPMSVVGNWHRETQRFAPSLKVMIHHGAERLCGENFRKEVKKHDLVISTYTLAQHDEKLFSSIHWECVALDEAQSIKNSAAKQTQAIRRLNAKCRVALTGTPVENRLAELWSIMEFLNPSYLRSAKEFHTNFAIPIEKYHNPERAETLKRLIQPFVLRRLKTDPNIINDLPEKMEMKVFCQLTREQASLYEAVLKEMVEKIENSAGIERKGLVLATLTKLKQVCNHPAQFLQDGSMLPGRSGKLTRLVEMLEEILAEDDRALIFTQFAEMGVMLRHHLQETLGSEVLFLHGGTTKKQRDSMVRRFQDGGPPLFILSLKAGGLGLNLTAANHVFHFDRWWNPAVENQATDRAFRIGQKKNVLVYKFSCLGTLEERIDQMIEQKKELAHSIVSSGETWLTEMSTDELKKIFTLSREAIGED